MPGVQIFKFCALLSSLNSRPGCPQSSKNPPLGCGEIGPLLTAILMPSQCSTGVAGLKRSFASAYCTPR